MTICTILIGLIKDFYFFFFLPLGQRFPHQSPNSLGGGGDRLSDGVSNKADFLFFSNTFLDIRVLLCEAALSHLPAFSVVGVQTQVLVLI